MIHGGFLDSIGYLLDSGVKVHMMYGDRDYPCTYSPLVFSLCSVL